MPRRIVWSSLVAVCLFGCGASEESKTDSPKPPVGGEGMKTPPGTPTGVETSPATPPATSESTPAASAGEAPALTPVPLETGIAKLSPENTRIEFVGTHAAPKPPDPRTGSFTKFSGAIEVDPATKSLKAIVMEIDPDSLVTAFDKLTNHLKTPDFLETREYPELKFQSASVEPGAAPDQFLVKGDLTLHGSTKPIAIPVTVAVSDSGVSLKAEFTIDRTEYGMDKMTEGVEKTVALKVNVGEKNVIPAPISFPGS